MRVEAETIREEKLSKLREGVDFMKGQERRRDEKKKPLKTLMEKRADKRAKKENRGTLIAPINQIKAR